ncbi:MAG: heme transporter, partial [Solirubrobacteraceae bacterium]|nr:heme transporter [Solirubrobacteraceae bacterium]
MHANTFAARAGRWSAQHRKIAIFGWIAFVVIAFVIGGAVGVKKPTEYIGPGDSGRADRLANDHFPKDAGESVLIQAAKGGSVRDADVRKAVDETIAAVSGKPRVAEVQSPYAKGNETQVSKDGRSVLVNFKLRGDIEQTGGAIDPV